MNYVRIFLITVALLNMHCIYNAEIISLTPTEETATKPAKNDVSAVAHVRQSFSDGELAKKEEKTDLQKWNDHLDLLTIKGEYWDSSDSTPLTSWQNTAFELATNVVKKDNSLASSLKTSFFDAIKAKIALEKGEFTKETTSLIAEFDAMIDAQLTPAVTETKEVPPVPILEVTPAQEPISEPEPEVAAQPEIPTTTQETVSTPTSTATDEAPQDLKSEWVSILESIKEDDSIGDSLNRAYELARELLLSGYRTIDLEKDFNTALETRMVQKKIDPNIIKNEINYFRMIITQHTQPSFVETTINKSEQERIAKQKLEFEKQQRIAEEKNAQLRKQQQEQEKQSKILLAAAQKAQEEGALSKEQAHQLAVTTQKLKEEYEAKLAENLEEIKAARQALAKNLEQMAASQKAVAEKGMLNAFTETISDWWYGTSAKKPAELSVKKQEELLTLMVKDVPDHMQSAAKETFKKFQKTLLAFDTPVDNKWIKAMSDLVEKIVMEYKLMTPDDISNMIREVLKKSEKISSIKLEKLITKIKEKTIKAIAEEKHKEAAKEALNQQRKEKREQLALAQQRIKAEEDRMRAEKQRKKLAAVTYRDEKKQWYELLDKVAHNRQATAQDNHTLTQEALKKSQSLLQLARDIPDKNKSSVGQKLKQKFSIALLEQQKNGNGPANIYQTIDLFNNEVNKMMD